MKRLPRPPLLRGPGRRRPSPRSAPPPSSGVRERRSAATAGAVVRSLVASSSSNFAGDGRRCPAASPSSTIIGRRRRLSSLPSPSNLPAPPRDDGNDRRVVDPNHYASLRPIDFATSSSISGEESQILEVNLRPHQMLRAESGAMLYMTRGVEMETSMGLTGGSGHDGGSGFSAGLTRAMTGQNLMVSDFRYVPRTTNATTNESIGDESNGDDDGGYGTVGLGTDFPAKILRFSLAQYPDSRLVCQKGAFLAGSHTVATEMAYAKSFASGFFGGEGFILQSLRGTAIDDEEETVFLKAYGTVVKRELKEGETLRVSSGSLVCMTSTVDYDVTTMPGFRNVMFGGEGLFVTTLSGPGTVWLQGMPIDRMVSEVARRVPSGGGIGLGIPIGVGGGGGEGAGDAAGDVGAGDAAAAEAASTGGDAGNEDSGVPVTDAAVEADRNATVASSGMTSDPESSESLFGDAAYGGGDVPESSASPESDLASPSDGFGEEGFSTDQFSEPDTRMPEFEEPKMPDEQQFEDDGTTFTTHEEGTGESAEAPTPGEDEGSGLLGQLWDMFRDFTDDD